MRTAFNPAVARAVATTFHAAAAFAAAVPPLRRDPLTLDLDNDGLETVGIDSGNPILFDHDGDGVKTATGWIKADDGLLVLDRNGNGVIDDGHELFGDSTPLAAGGNALDGFGALAQEDTNADGRVNSADARFGQLRLWRDLNPDGNSQSDELFALGSAGVAALLVAKTENAVILQDGNQIADLGSFVRSDGSGGTLGTAEQLADIDLASDPFYRQFIDHIELTATAKTLPDMQGSGMVRNLREAASLPSAEGAALAAKLAEYGAAATRAQQLALLDGLVQAWAATSALPGRSENELQLALFVRWIPGVLPDGTRWGWIPQFADMPHDLPLYQQTLQTLRVVEAFNGSRFPTTTLFAEQISLLEQCRAAVNTSVYDGLVLQTRLKPYLDAIGLNIAENGVRLDYDAMTALLDAKKVADIPNAVFDLVDLFQQAGSQLSGWDWAGKLEAWAAEPASSNAVMSALAAAGFTTPSGLWSGGRGNDSMFGSTGADQLLGLAGDDLLLGGAGNDTLIGGIGKDLLAGGAGTDLLMAGNQTAPNTYTTNPYENSANTLQGGGGNDSLYGGGGSDTYLFNLGDGADTLTETGYQSSQYAPLEDSGTDRILLGAGIAAADVTVTRSGTALILGFANAGDKITISGWYGSSTYRVEQLVFADGMLWDRPTLHNAGLTVNGTTANDTLYGMNGEGDSLIGGGGDDTLIGYGGSDSLVGGAGRDMLLAGSQSNPSAYTTDPYESAANTLNGGAGNDSLYGGGGSDSYLFNLGDGADSITETGYQASPAAAVEDVGTDRLVLGNAIAPADVAVTRSGNALILNFANPGDKITISGWYASPTYRVEQLVFADGMLWDRAALHNAGLTVNGTTANDTLYGMNGEGDSLIGGGGDDTLIGYGGSDSLAGGAGRDVLLAGSQSNPGTYTTDPYESAANTLNGGAGNDSLYGGGGSDTYLFNLGDGADSITETGYQASPAAAVEDVGTDRIVLGNAIAPADITVTRSGNALILNFANPGDKITISGWYASPTYRVEQLLFADGTQWSRGKLHDLGLVLIGTTGNDTLYGLAGEADVIDGGSGNDTLSGGSGNDVYLFGPGSGQDLIDDNDTMAGNLDTIRIVGKLPAEVAVRRSATNDLVITIHGTNDKLTVKSYFAATSYRIEQVKFDDGTVLTAADLDQAVANAAPTGNLTINGTALQNQILTTSNTLADSDGLGTMTYRWQSSVDGSVWNDINGAATTSLTLDESLVGKQIRVSASYVDGRGSNETRTSAATSSVVNINDAPSGTVIISGTAIRNQTLTAGNTLADADGLGAVSYQWQCSADGSTWRDIAAAATASLTLTEAQIGSMVRVLARYTDGHGTLESIISGTTATVTNAHGAPLTLTGDAAGNLLYGEDGNDTLDGSAGADTMSGGPGNDSYVVDCVGDVVVEKAGEGADTVNSHSSYTLAANVENLVLLGTAATDGTGNELGNRLTGNGATNSLTGGAGKDTLDGGAGADTLIGQPGNDVYLVDNLDDQIVEDFAEGCDAVRSTVSWTLGANLENLILVGTAAISGTGNELDNILLGNGAANSLRGGAGNDTLNGAAGADTMMGGAGNDNYTIDNPGDIIVELPDDGLDTVNSAVSHTLSANLERLTLIGTARIDGTGNALNNLLTGNSAANLLSGRAGNDTLNGAGGADTLNGGAGDDLYVVDNSGDIVGENADEGNDSVTATVSSILPDNVENLTLTGTTAISGTGNALDNLLIGNGAANLLTGGSGADTLIGGFGIDTLAGGEGNDRYIVDHIADVVIEHANQGVDSVLSSVSYTLAAEVENLALTGTANANATGNGLDNLLAGTINNNTLAGLDGNDTLDGLAGNDILVGGPGNDTYVFGRGYAADVIRENDATPGNQDMVQFLAGIGFAQIWLQHVGNNLVASIIGTKDRLTLENWYLGPAYRVEQFRTADGRLLEEDQVEDLVKVMGVYALPALGQSVLPLSYQNALTPVLEASWQ